MRVFLSEDTRRDADLTRSHRPQRRSCWQRAGSKPTTHLKQDMSKQTHLRFSKMPIKQRDQVSPLTLMINRWERDLILRFGYPFEAIDRPLKESGNADLARVVDQPYWWEQVILNLRISEEEKPEVYTDPVPTASLNALIERIAIQLGLL